MVDSARMKGKVELEYRTEQIIAHEQICMTLSEIIIKQQMEQGIVVSHPELAPEPYETKADSHFLLRGKDGKHVSICIDYHGTWHEKNKVQVRDQRKREILNYNGHHYIEFRNYAGAEECPILWEVVDLIKQMKKTSKPNVAMVFQEKINKKMVNAMAQLSQQMALQLADSRPREVSPQGILS